MEEALRALLRGNPAVAALVGTRVDWGMRPQGSSLPAICLTVISDAPVNRTLDGPGPSQARVQVDCFGATYASAKTVARAVRRALDGRKDQTFLGIFIAGARDLPDDDGVSTVHNVSMDFFVNYHFN
jgi:hypothetical protein